MKVRNRKWGFVLLLLALVAAASLLMVIMVQAEDEEAPPAEKPAVEHVATAKAAVVDEAQVGEVLVDDQLIATIYTLTPDLTGIARAEIGAERLNKAFESEFAAEDIQVVKQNGVWVMAIGDTAILTATVVDAQPQDKSARELAEQWRSELIKLLFPEARAPKAEDYNSWGNKIVPLLSMGKGLRLGGVQVTGPKENLDQCKAVVVLEGQFKDKFRARVLVPVGSTDTKNLDRISKIGVTGLVDVKL